MFVPVYPSVFLYPPRDHNENKIYPDLYYAIPAIVSLIVELLVELLFPTIYSLLGYNLRFKNYRGGGGAAPSHLRLLFCKIVYNFRGMQNKKPFEIALHVGRVISLQSWKGSQKYNIHL